MSKEGGKKLGKASQKKIFGRYLMMMIRKSRKNHQVLVKEVMACKSVNNIETLIITTANEMMLKLKKSSLEIHIRQKLISSMKKI